MNMKRKNMKVSKGRKKMEKTVLQNIDITEAHLI